MHVAIIPARGGSKRIPKKNIKDFCGRPIIEYSIQTAIISGLFDKIFVSTDDLDIANIALASGACVIERPIHLSCDNTPTIPVIRHAINELYSIGYKLDTVCCIYPTAPFLRAKDLNIAHDLILDNSAIDFSFSATEYPFPIFRSFLYSNKRIEMVFPDFTNNRSQDLPITYHDAGQFYIGRPDSWLTHNTVFTCNSTPIVLPSYRVIDIDTPDDWERAELMASNLFGR